jgi:hypothetical protein
MPSARKVFERPKWLSLRRMHAMRMRRAIVGMLAGDQSPAAWPRQRESRSDGGRGSVNMRRVRGWASATLPRRRANPAIIPLPAAVTQHPDRYVAQYPTEVEDIKSDPPLLWSTVGPRRRGS